MEPLLEVRHLKKYYQVRKGLFHSKSGQIKAVDDVSFALRRGETLGLVGESGCGKSTLAHTLARLSEPTSGSVLFKGRDIFTLGKEALREQRRELQIIFQSPYSSFDPKQKVEKIASQAVLEHRIVPDSEVKEYIIKILGLCGLGEEHLGRYPSGLSGGECQRLAIARAIALRPELLIADEPVSALDLSIQAEIINLLEKLKEEESLSYLFISHDLSLIRYISDSVAVMYLGTIVEKGEGQEVFSHPLHPYTRALLSSIPGGGAERRIRLKGEVPSAAHIPMGCRFHTRCPYAMKICREAEPEERSFGSGHLCSCHLL